MGSLTIYERTSVSSPFTQSMEVNTDKSRPSAMVRPLHVRKTSSQTHNSQDPHRGPAEKAVYPPRTSSIRSNDNVTAPFPEARAKPSSAPFNREDLLIATSPEGPHFTRPSFDAESMSRDSAGSTISSFQSRIHSDASIMGNFVPIDSPNMAGLEPDMEPPKVYLQK